MAHPDPRRTGRPLRPASLVGEAHRSGGGVSAISAVESRPSALRAISRSPCLRSRLDELGQGSARDRQRIGSRPCRGRRSTALLGLGSAARGADARQEPSRPRSQSSRPHAGPRRGDVWPLNLPRALSQRAPARQGRADPNGEHTVSRSFGSGESSRDPWPPGRGDNRACRRYKAPMTSVATTYFWYFGEPTPLAPAEDRLA